MSSNFRLRGMASTLVISFLARVMVVSEPLLLGGLLGGRALIGWWKELSADGGIRRKRHTLSVSRRSIKSTTRMSQFTGLSRRTQDGTAGQIGGLSSLKARDGLGPSDHKATKE